MAITLHHLCKYARENYGMSLVCGENNMNNIVTWVHMLEDPETAGFLHGQELVFTTGIGHDNTDWFLDFAKGLVANQASGLVLNIGPYIRSVPDDLVQYCREVQFPLFTIPWKTRIVDITNDFCRKIIKSEENEVTVASAFRSAIYTPEKISEYRPFLERKEFNLEADFCITALSLQVADKNKFSDYDKYVRLFLTKLLISHSERFSIFRQDMLLILVLQSFPQAFVEEALKKLNNMGFYGDHSYRIFAGISMNEPGIATLSRNCKRAMSLLMMAEKQGKTCLSYKDMGLYQLILEIDDAQVLRNFYDETLGKLDDFDRKNGTDYLETLRLYLEKNASVQEVAKFTFVHRNTINYKIKRIKEILQSDISYKDSLKLVLAFCAKEII